MEYNKKGDMSLNYYNFYPYGPYQQHEDDDVYYQNEFYPQYDERIFPGFPGGGPGGGFPGGPGGPGGGFPGGGFPGGPGGPGGGFPGGGPGGGQQGGGAPTAPPPQFTPQETQASAFAVDPGGIRRCLYRYTYVWLNNGNSFWYFPTFVGRNSVAGWRWRRRWGWVYFGIDLRQIRSFQCF
jgi:hypothetical protein